VSELERIERILQEQLKVLIRIETTQKLILAALSPSYPQSTGGTITVK
jgi:hypothetical protein